MKMILKILFWLYIGWWFYPCKWIISKFSKQPSQSPISHGINQIQFKSILDGIPRTQFLLSDKPRKRFQSKSFRVSTTNLTKQTSLSKLKRGFVALDTETTGLDADNDFIVEVSAIKFVNFEPVEHFTTLIKPEKSIPSKATKISGITNIMVANAPSFSQIAPALADFISSFPIVAHNAEFDCKFLYASGLGEIKKNVIYDTLEISRNVTTDSSGNRLSSYKLVDVCAKYHIAFNAHRASADCFACGLLFLELICERHNIHGNIARKNFFSSVS